MGKLKRSNLVVVLSSSDDDDKNGDIYKSCYSSKSKSNSNRIDLMSNSKSKTSISSARRGSSIKSTRKKSRVSNSLSYSDNLFPDFSQDEFLSHGFADKVSTGNRRFDGQESWVDKYRPPSLEELAVHKKKVEEVKFWFEERLSTSSKKGIENYALVITGQTGTGKSATVHVMASHFGAEVCEWNTPTPTIWHEHVHNSNSGMRYISKLDEFENFVDRVRKYGLLSSSVTGAKSPLILLIEDLPVANGKVAQGRILRCMQVLVKSVQIPTVILITDYGRADSADASLQYWEELSASLENVGAYKVSFNPITTGSVKKVLSRICRDEQCATTPEQIDLIVNTSGGDIRNAIMSLQYISLNLEKKLILSSKKKGISSSQVKVRYPGQDPGLSLPVGRDLTLSLFHALGKFLHNKREAESNVECCENVFDMKEGFRRLPLKMDAPEKVLCQAYGQARPVTEFLHENVLDFLSEEAIEDAWVVSSYLSDADCLLASAHQTFTRSYEAENVMQSSAASVAVRGVLFGNSHPSPSRWHSIRRPMLWQVEQSIRCNMGEMERQRLNNYNGLTLSGVSTFCVEYRPALKWLGYRASLHPDPSQYDELDNKHDLINFQDSGSIETDDEIEDCD